MDPLTDPMMWSFFISLSVMRTCQRACTRFLSGHRYGTLNFNPLQSSFPSLYLDAAVPILSNGGSPGRQIINHSPSLEISEKKNPSDATEEKGDLSNDSDSCSSQIHYQQLETEVNQVLRSMRKAQDSEYKMAEERLHAQKKYLHNLYEQLEHEISDLRKQGLSNNSSKLVNSVSKRKDQIKREQEKLSEMKEVAKGFGRTSKGILREHFGLELE